MKRDFLGVVGVVLPFSMSAAEQWMREGSIHSPVYLIYPRALLQRKERKGFFFSSLMAEKKGSDNNTCV